MIAPNSTYSFQKYFFLLFLFYLAFFSIFFVVEFKLTNSNILAEGNFLNWDAAHYAEIKQNGYHNENVAFFPAFPFLWHWLQAGAKAMAVVNGLIFIISFSWVAKEFQIRIQNLFLLATVPSMIFMFLPFSETVFFASTAALLIGYRNDNIRLVAFGIFFAGLCRPVAAIFIPAIIITELLSNTRDFKNQALLKSKNLFRLSNASCYRLTVALASCLLSLFAAFFLQYLQTGEWFRFFQVQHDWSNYLRLPSFPLNSWAGGLIVRLDAIALFAGAVALVTLIYLIGKKERTRQITEFSYSPPVVFSISYLALLSITVLFTKGGMLNSFNRYLFSTSFFMVAASAVLESRLFTQKNLVRLFFFSTVFWLLFASYVHIQAFLKFELLSLYLCVLLLYLNNNNVIKQASFFLIATINIIFLVIFFHRFLSGLWVG